MAEDQASIIRFLRVMSIHQSTPVVLSVERLPEVHSRLDAGTSEWFSGEKRTRENKQG
jgi:hypothetical protein